MESKSIGSLEIDFFLFGGLNSCSNMSVVSKQQYSVQIIFLRLMKFVLILRIFVH